jgi:FHA domain
VSSNSGCGAYYNAQTALDLANVYVALWHVSTGKKILSQKTGQITQDETKNLGNTVVPAGQSQMEFTLNWPGSRLEPLLTDPSGKLVDTNYPGASIYSANTIASVIVNQPAAGQWHMAARGVDVPEGVTTYQAVISSRGGAALPPTPANASVAVVVVLVAGGGLAVFLYSQNVAQTRRRAVAGPISQGADPVAGAQLLGLSGELAGRALTLTPTFTIGRSAGNLLRLTDLAVSRRHVVLRYGAGQWFVQDQGSALGTYVNGQRVTATALRNGDRIRIGASEFEFRLL